ncbi:MAG: hypothetical protein CM15mP79_2650 [Methanobacteriota archaeon]|nr:hypothetical protein [Candidatus Thermoplasmatota archaeon]GIR77328.1 MAG: hypothetical protein CM15mP79_2650 [Euryarchaeota archaeon]
MNEEYENGTLQDINGMATTAQVFAEERMLYAASQAALLSPLTSRPSPVQITGLRAERGNSGFPV